MVSIIISVYNVEKYLDECLSSIFNQSYKNIEVIIINDGSTDNSLEFINKYRKKHSNIVYIEQKNKGLSEARNLGLSIANGKYILYIDSDDYIDKDMLKLMVEKITNDNSDIVIIGHSEFYEDISEKGSDIYLDIDEKNIYTGLEVANMMLDCTIMGVAWNKLYKKDKLIEEKFNFESGRYTQDWYPTFKHIVNLEKVSFINKPLYKYRLRYTSTTSKKNEKRLEDYNYAVSNIINYVQDTNIQLNKNSINRFKAITLSMIISLYYNMKVNEKLNIYKEFKNSKYNQNNISILELIKTNGLKKTNIMYILAWKLRIYKELLYVEKKLRSMRNR